MSEPSESRAEPSRAARQRAPSLDRLRRQAVAASLFPPTTLGRAITALGFVQADPIRAPARAQDLILRHRVRDYRIGELERRFTRLRLEEDRLHAYGFMPAAIAALLHPRHDAKSADGRHRPDGLAAEVLAFVREQGLTHPRDLDAAFGREQTVNGWGGISQATTRALQSLHYHGLLRVARRRDGIRIYEAVPQRPEPLAAEERLRLLVLLILTLLSPVSQTCLGRALPLLTRGAPGLGNMRRTLRELQHDGAVESAELDGEAYFWVAARRRTLRDAERQVRFLAPFDPIVWDRRRFEHFWGWPYRFEAYTPPPRRRFGYYAMPLLWDDRVIGWANLRLAAGRLQLALGYAEAEPQDPAFRRALDEEIARITEFLRHPSESSEEPEGAAEERLNAEVAEETRRTQRS
jgi:uncharacterized protein YcaQ